MKSFPLNPIWVLVLLVVVLLSSGCPPETPVTPCTPFASCSGYQSCGPNSARFAYGTKPRQVFELIKAANSPSAPVVIFIHGGGWFSGPNASRYPQNINELSLIPIDVVRKRLVDEKKVALVHLKYSLMPATESNFANNASYMEDLMDEVQMAVDFIRNNASCLDVNPNRFTFIGESAGGHIALTYAYTRSDPAITKAVGAMFPPTDLQAFGQYLVNKECFDSLVDDPCTYLKFAYYFATPASNNLEEFNWDGNNALTCNPKKTLTYNLIQSLAGEAISNPSSNQRLRDLSPKYALGATRNIPTFIQHGSDDRIVPYIQAQQSMVTELGTYGGVETTTACATCRHKVKIYDYFDHGWGTPLLGNTLIYYDLDVAVNGNCPVQFTQSGDYTPIADDMVNWLSSRL